MADDGPCAAKSADNFARFAERDIFDFVIPPGPDGDTDYAVSFESSEAEAIKEFFDEFGFVVVRNAVTGDEADAVLDDMFDVLESNSDGFDRTDRGTWGAWSKLGLEHYGQIQKEPVFSAPVLAARQSPAIHAAAVAILGTDDILVNHDRYGLFRPTVDVVDAAGNALGDMVGWRTRTNLHLDMSPWAYLDDDPGRPEEMLARLSYGRKTNHFIHENNQVHKSMQAEGVILQATLNLVDNREDDGGLWLVPGFRHHFETWAANLSAANSPIIAQSLERNSVSFGKNDVLRSLARRITMRAGSICFWDQRTPHGSRCNVSSNFRAAMFLKVFPADTVDENRGLARTRTVERQIRAAGFGNSVTPLGRRVFGLDRWGTPIAGGSVGTEDQQSASSRTKKEKKKKKKGKAKGKANAKGHRVGRVQR